MPQATEAQRALMQKWFGDPISESGPEAFLKSHGYTLLADWLWEKPVSSHTISDAEYECLSFLVNEWDYGGIAHHE